MEPNPYYEENIPWAPHHSYQEQMSEYQEQVPEYQEEPSFSLEQMERYQKLQPMPRLPKAQSLALIHNMKSLLIISVLGFAGLGWLIAAQSAVTSQLITPHRFPYAAHRYGDRGSFFDQQGGTYFGRHRHHDFGQNQPPQDQNSGPISGTHVS